MRKKRKQPASAPGHPEDTRWCNPFQGLHLEGLNKPKEPTPPKSEQKQTAPDNMPATLSKEDQELLRSFADNATALPNWQKDDNGKATTPTTKIVRKKLLTLAVERKGRGGKTVTIVRGLNDLPITTQMELCAAIKNALGTGARFRETTLELQGDQRQRAATWLETKNFQCRIL